MKRVKFALALLLVALVSVIVWLLMVGEREPVYEGRTLTAWLEASQTNSSGYEEFLHAVRQTGTNAIPTLLGWLQKKDSPLKVRLIHFLQRQHLVKIEFMPAVDLNGAASEAFGVLGTNAESAVPAIVDIVHQNISSDSRLFALRSLGMIGPPAKAAIPALLMWTYAPNAEQDLQKSAEDILVDVDEVGAARWKRTSLQAKLLRQESFEQSLNDVITNGQQFFFTLEPAHSCLDAMLAAPRVVKIMQLVESLNPTEREAVCRRIFAQAFTVHSNTIAAIYRMRADPSAPKNHQSMISTGESVGMAMFIAADLGLRSLLAEEFRAIGGLRDPGFSILDSDFQLNILQLVASQDAELNRKVSRVVGEEMKAEQVRIRLVTVFDGEIDWFARIKMGNQNVEAPMHFKTWQFVNWARDFKLVDDPQDALVEKLERLVLAGEPR